MKWSIDWILRKFYAFIKQVFFFLVRLLKVIVHAICLIFYKIYLYFCLVYYLFIPYGDKFIIVIDYFLFIFITIPWFIYGEFFKPLLVLIYSGLVNFFSGYALLQKFFNFVLRLSITFVSFLCKVFKKAYFYLFKKFIDFLFFDVYRNRFKIANILHKILINFIRVLLVYFLFYQNKWGQVFNIFFSAFNENFAWWNFSTWTGIFYIVLTF